MVFPYFTPHTILAQPYRSAARRGAGQVCPPAIREPYPYLILDARYEKVREDGAVRSQAAGELATTLVTRSRVGGQRRSCRPAPCHSGSIARSGLAALLRALSMQR